MNKYSRIFRYIGQYKSQVVLYFLFIILSIVFSIVSLGMLMPFLDLIFKGEGSSASQLMQPTSNPAVAWIRDFLTGSIASRGKVPTLGIICILIITSILLKNVFLVLSFYVLNPLKNRVVNQLRTDLYEKILHLPIGYFTEKKKGDLISRITILTEQGHVPWPGAAALAGYRIHRHGVGAQRTHV